MYILMLCYQESYYNKVQLRILCVGLNLMSQFNVENITVYNTKSDDLTVFKSVSVRVFIL